MNVSLVVNPIAGNKAYKSIKKLESLLRGKVSLTTFVTENKGDAFDFAKEQKDSGRIIVAGGDGTVNEVINGILSSNNADIKNASIAIVPLGTANVMAKELGIPEEIEKALELSLQGTPKRISLGRINGKYFSLMAGIGFDGETVLGVKSGLFKKVLGKGAYVLSGLNTLMKYHPPRITLKTMKEETSGYTAVISNARCYGGKFYLTPDASITEPVLDICLFRNNTRRGIARLISGVLRNRHLNDSDVSHFKASEIEISSPGIVHVQIDGDYFGTLPVKIETVKDALNLIW